MYVIQPHYHAIARTTDDYERMAMSGVVAVGEPAFWAGFDRLHAGSFIDYFRQISEFEPTRAAQYGIKHYCWVGMNPKESDNLTISREVISQLPEFFKKPTVIGVGEIGLNKNTANEITIFREQLELAIRHNQLILIHTPHLGDKAKGARITMDLLRRPRRRRRACGWTTAKSTRSARFSKPAIGPGSRSIPSPRCRPAARWTSWSATPASGFSSIPRPTGAPARPSRSSSASWNSSAGATASRKPWRSSITAPRMLGQCPRFTIKPIRIQASI